ncbi:30S ribosomal protein S6 [Candidatus Roizmanbacteria bacterium CG02_land_8_20_14_3_00_36_15]|uniref:Small ribosomal subunit protein bS6 n=2 Tax=Candidatus Roizmaniibacteriota TaxID=1752723 RepID=A0A2M8KKU5_9BACT|nr:MAG: 30S ribosomal protein S6 [Candidatus Roizmanbacteria bacterium CG03_land_8_20_14_0_80_36_21]PIV37829.1 MAG: 30S ribosomal protein S6 [Candidatus Roizmanbacteria bacterium CG02_land_8_20_14_3_00_36_15]PIY70376.1 MAG: 30S ribosomal protein S6 [Candidatus Roizmanbacteria bacterium CG_4_10_14_0_8_um_filter_36_36]PJA52835.1 MAG: 30S ribosomal protein S6 [Candidatus Roizmanbacteria bacterium CG_4_9_14_3_um_filter_36_11]PJE60546.1 MAG: 30S ribosomal protein S6 [Candidatus Roizmanbacteria bacte
MSIPTYEFTFLLNEEEELKKIKELITSLNGKINQEESWGKKTLAFPIKKNRSASFYQWIIELAKPQIKEFKEKLNFNTKIIRYLILTHEL